MASKIVVIGSANGNFTAVFDKITTLHAKQSFDIAILVGDFFADPETATEDQKSDLSKLLRGKIIVPLSTYFALGHRPLPNEVIEVLDKNQGELCPNLSILGRKVSIKTSEGFRIVAVGGTHATSADVSMSEYAPEYTDEDAKTVGQGLVNADILVTSDWPSHIQHGSKAYEGAPPPSANGIAELCTALKPRYHFSASEMEYARQPFFHNGPSPRSITHFYSLAPFGTPKQKSIRAFTLEPSAAPPQVPPADCTASPLTSVTAINGGKRKLESQESDYNNFCYSNGNGTDRYTPAYSRGNKRQRGGRGGVVPTPDQCYFCLSRADAELHLLTSIGEESYLTVPKGPLTLKDTYPELGFPGHVLIIPQAHTPTISALPDPASRQATATEMRRYQSALQDMLVAKTKGQDGRSKLGAVTWEISKHNGVHVHWQFLPVKVDLIAKHMVEVGFQVEAENSDYPKFVTDSKEMDELQEGNYFKVTIWSEALRKEMVMPLDGDFRFDLQFGRRVLAKLLKIEDRTHWKNCGQTKAEEEADAAAFKEAFEEFDFTT